MNIKIMFLVLTSLFCTSAFANLEAGSGTKSTQASLGGYSWQAGRCHDKDLKLVAMDKCPVPSAYNQAALSKCIDLSTVSGIADQIWWCPATGQDYVGGAYQRQMCDEDCAKAYKATASRLKARQTAALLPSGN